MTRTTVTRTINAPIDLVFQTVSDINNFSKAIPHITKVEMLSDVKSGVGTRFRETRVMGGREASTELEVTEFVDNERVRLVAESHGTVWDTVFSIKPEGTGTTLTMVMDARGQNILAKIMNPLTMGFVKRALEKDIDAVKTYCENVEARSIE